MAKIKAEGDTIGGIIRTVARGVKAGLGQPIYDKLQARLAYAMLSINAVKGFSYGAGFESVHQKGSQQNDVFEEINGQIKTKTNHSGGIQGGISNGELIYFDTLFKPVSSIFQVQETLNKAGEKISFENKGRHDSCVVPRAVPIVEAMTALVLLDFCL